MKENEELIADNKKLESNLIDAKRVIDSHTKAA